MFFHIIFIFGWQCLLSSSLELSPSLSFSLFPSLSICQSLFTSNNMGYAVFRSDFDNDCAHEQRAIVYKMCASAWCKVKRYNKTHEERALASARAQTGKCSAMYRERDIHYTNNSNNNNNNKKDNNNVGTSLHFESCRG